MAKGHSGDAGCSQVESSWVWYKSLMFLKNQVISRKMSSNLPRVVKDPVNEESDTQADVADDDKGAKSRQEDITTIEPENATPVAKRVKRARNNTEDAILDVENKKLKIIESYMEKTTKLVPEDDNYHFLMSLKKPLGSLSIDRQMFVRYKIQELIYNEISNITETPAVRTNIPYIYRSEDNRSSCSNIPIYQNLDYTDPSSVSSAQSHGSY